MTATIVIDVITLVVSVLVSVFIGGVRYGTTQGIINSIDRRLGNIEAMFTLTLKGDNTSEARNISGNREIRGNRRGNRTGGALRVLPGMALATGSVRCRGGTRHTPHSDRGTEGT